MCAIKFNCLTNVRTSFEHPLAGIAAHPFHAMQGFPLIIESRYPIVGEPFSVCTALCPAVVEPHIGTAVNAICRGEKPDSRVWVREILVIEEERSAAIR